MVNLVVSSKLLERIDHRQVVLVPSGYVDCLRGRQSDLVSFITLIVDGALHWTEFLWEMRMKETKGSFSLPIQKQLEADG